MTALPVGFLHLPIAHRALHGQGPLCPENSRAAIRAAMAAGYGIELDLQLSRDGRAMVFHDADLARLTGRTGRLDQCDAAELGQIALSHGDGEGIPRLDEVLSLVAGRVPLLLEIKDPTGCLGPTDAVLETAVLRDLSGYAGPVALMSFNPHVVIALRHLAPHLPRGIVTCDYSGADWPDLDRATRARLRTIPDYDASGAVFISHQADDLDRPRVAELRQEGATILCWTIRSPLEEAAARRHAHNITFEGYRAALPA